MQKELRSLFTLTAFFMAVVFFASTAMAQRKMARMYNPATEVKVNGTIEEVQQIQGRGAWSGTHLTLKTDSGTLQVHIGPSSYLSEKGFSLTKGDKVEVLGSKVTMNSKETLLAREITKDNKTLTLRNAQGIPLWSGGWRHSQ